MPTTAPPATTDDRFTADVLESELPVLVDFWAAWCPPCRAMRPVLAALDAERDDLRIVSLDVDEQQRTALRYRVLSMARRRRAQPRDDERRAGRRGAAQPRRRHEADAEPLVDEPADDRRVAGLEQRHRAEAGRRAGGEHRGAQRAARLGQHERSLAQLPHGDLAGLRERVAGRRDRQQRLLLQAARVDAAGHGGGGQRRDAEVDGAGPSAARVKWRCRATAAK